MKKILSIIIALFIGVCAFGQVSVNGGYLHSTYKATSQNVSVNFAGNGLYGGVSYDIKSSNYPQISFVPGININFVDIKELESTDTFLSVPLFLKYNLPINNVYDGFVSVGSTLIYALDGGGFDMALGFEGGIQFSNNIKLMCGYDFGIINQNSDGDIRLTRNTLHIGVGYMF